jgi:hypothetical protein
VNRSVEVVRKECRLAAVRPDGIDDSAAACGITPGDDDVRTFGWWTP